MTASKQVCIHCEKDSTEVPLIALQYRGADFWICPQHLPILIHQPTLLSDKLPGMDRLAPAEHAHD